MNKYELTKKFGKMGHIYHSLMQWNKNNNGYPTQAQIHLTNFCNLKCFFCPTRTLLGGNLKKEDELTTNQWLSIIDEANEMGVDEWHICGGGEPLFFKDRFSAVIEKIKKSGKRGELITNGVLFDNRLIEKMVELSWDKITFSLDSPLSEIQNELRGKDCFEDIVKNIKYFSKVKKARETNYPVLCIHSVICNKNYKQITELIELAKEIGVDEVLLNALNIWSSEIEKLKLTDDQEKELIPILDNARRLADDLDISTNIEEFLKSELFKKANIMDKVMKNETKNQNDSSTDNILNVPCYYPWYNLSIFPDGTVQPCFIPQGTGEQIKDKKLKEIWFGRVFSDFRNQMKKGNVSKYCEKCNPWNLEKMSEIRENLRKELDH